MTEKKDSMKNHIINLKVISKLQPHVRIDTSGSLFKIYTPAAYLPTWAQRWFASHNRKQDLSRVTLLFEEVTEAIKNGCESEQLISALRESIVGLRNLKTTYEEDITSVSSIEYIIDHSTPYISSEHSKQ